MNFMKIIRVIAAIFFISALSLLFLDFTGTAHRVFGLGWTSRIQLIPAILALNFVFLAIVFAITLLFGRIYCSVICPLGTLQDIISRITGIFKKDRFSHRPSQDMFVFLRFAILAIFVFALVAAIPIITVNLEPYSIFGRIISQIFAPLYILGNNVLAHFAERAGSYAFFGTDILITSAVTLAVAIISFIVIAIFAIKSGRGFCNTLCPVGAFFSLLSQLCLMKPPVWEKCNSCGLCAKKCKSGCIDTVSKKVDYLRCVSCFNCYGACSQKVFSVSWENPFSAKKSAKNPNTETQNPNFETPKLTDDGKSRRGFIAGMSVLALGFFTRAFSRATFQFDGGLAPLEDKIAPKRAHSIIPPGARNIRNFRRRCTACLQCVTVCRNQVLRPSSGISDFMQPHLSFERGFCRPECVACSRVCPTGAIQPITRAEKTSIQIGYAVWVKELCVNITDDASCDLCAHRCPTGAITMIAVSEDSPQRRPMIDIGRCTGCGACEFLCPSRPHSAIYVEGIGEHREI